MNKPAIGITLGDYNGIGPEVILKALNHNILLQWCTPVVYGSLKVLNFYKKQFDMRDFHFQVVDSPDKIKDSHAHVINCWDDANTQVEPGKETKEAGAAAFACLERACKDLDGGKIAAVVTAPINKNNIQSEQFNFPGHTEYLTQKFEVKESLMMMVAENFRIGVATGHLPVLEVSKKLSKELLKTKIDLFLHSLKEDFKIIKPKLAVLGLNPHAGESGLLGKEELEIIQPVLDEYRQKGQLVFGPYPADGFFGKAQFKEFDGVLGMYHDQGLIPFKYIAFDSGVNYTAGLPIIRTSPDHGTAYDIAGKNEADPGSFLHAFYLALDLVKNRMND
ncbi:4-hydroxythreonine-4-phosphate dehydrogenase PdxA [Sandaracinomonas limnophila]|uniref:4-hydroxythreonine-4-phosphate dehydrogenase PdxA n=1 Tax=Sandaracinomonas limnophila TaxID=1862386 RepID=A0A437PQY0_9BACT|nr:4-hydroxythreonine-4-phosphate dehydrogenase PdxA [Sandaracinomonas limnophila]RVU24647.1 4-hydroxythreonine-4-phosphate dehydrogenase PdxA [Sandaracinomonas limnophila]